MKISVILPVYNRPREVSEAIRSALAQTRAPDEIIVVDDGSTDETASVVSGFGEPVRLVRMEQNQGAAAARNLGAEEARGEWLAFLDSDDLWLPEKLSAQAALCQGAGPRALVHTDGWVIDGHEVPKDLDPKKTMFANAAPPEGPESLKRYLRKSIATPSVMLRRDVFLDAGGFDPSFRINEDADLYLRLFAQGYEAAFVPRPLVIVRNLPDRKKPPWMVFFEESIRLFENARQNFPAHRSLFDEVLAEKHRNAARCALVQADQRQAARCLMKSFSFRRPSLKELIALTLLIGGGEPGKRALMRRWDKSLEIYRQ